MPMSFPVWFAVLDRTICISTRPKQKKLVRIQRDPRASFVVEQGEYATELRGVHLTGRVEVVEDSSEFERIAVALEDKYRGFRPPEEEVAEQYRRSTMGRTLLRFRPDAKILSWDFSRRYSAT
jgi:nitroimidazol reductase NimA-like FMN-containing flavoprotein (pyridoxamine 5'-phosphate oxidase superfamily)